MRPPDLQPISERRARELCLDALDQALSDADARLEAAKLRDDPFAERSDGDAGEVDDPYPDDFTGYYGAIELEGAL